MSLSMVSMQRQTWFRIYLPGLLLLAVIGFPGLAFGLEPVWQGDQPSQNRPSSRIGIGSGNNSADGRGLGNSAGQQQESLTFTEKLKVKDIPLDFRAFGFNWNASGSRAVVWGSQPRQKSQGSLGSISVSSEAAVIDLETHTVLAKKPFPAGIQASAIDDRYTYIAPKSGNLFYRFDRDTLKNDRRKFVNFRINTLTPVAGGKIKVNGTLVLDRESLEDVESEDGLTPAQRQMNELRATAANGSNANLSFHLPGGLKRQDGGIFDVDTGQLRVLTDATGLINISGRAQSPGRMLGPAPGLCPWGRQLVGTTVRDSAGQLVFTIDSTPGRTSVRRSRSQPVIFKIRQARVASREPVLKTFFDAISIDDGSVVESWLLDSVSDQVDNIYAVGDQLVLRSAGKIQVFQEPKIEPAKLKVPLHFKTPKLATAKFGEPLQVKLELESAKGNVSFSLTHEYPGLELDSETGTLSFDFQKTWDAAMNPVQIRSLFTYVQTAERRATAAKIDIPAGHVPFVTYVEAVATDETGAQAMIYFYPVVSIPESTVNQAIETAKNQPLAGNSVAAVPPRIGNPSDRTNREVPAGTDIKQLEQRVRRLEAALDGILMRLEKLTDKDR